MTDSAERPRARLITGTVIGHRFHVLEEAGEGGMGVAYLSLDLLSQKKVIIKVPQLPGTADLPTGDYRRTMKRFTREARTLRTLDHENIPKLIGEGEHGSLPYIAMTYIRGSNLGDYRMSNSPREHEFAAIGTTVARTLAACHEKGIVHRDLKPTNVMVGANGVVYVIDFGIAIPLDRDASRYTQSFVGSDEYMAPERFDNAEPDLPVDLYSLGCVLYFLLTARPPFIKESGKSVKEQHLDDAPVPPSRLNNQVARDLEELTLGLLAKNADDRPDTSAVLAVLKPYLPADGAPEPNPVLQPDVTFPYRAPERVRPPEAAAQSRTKPIQPFRAQPRHDFVTKTEIVAAIERATEENSRGETATATEILEDLHRRAVGTYGTGSSKLEPIVAALNRIGGR